MHTPVGGVALVWPDLPFLTKIVAQPIGLECEFCPRDGTSYVYQVLFAVLSNASDGLICRSGCVDVSMPYKRRREA